jgi:hypothetical protein
MYALAKSDKGSRHSINEQNNNERNAILVCASGLDGCRAIDSFHALIASSYSSEHHTD